MKRLISFSFLILCVISYSQTPVPIRPIPGVISREFVSDITMNYTFTGPISAIAVNPSTSQHIVIAAASGGLFETRNAGGPNRKWKSIPEFREHEIMDVLITPAAGGENIWVACSNTFEKVNGPLIWRKEVSGRWTKIQLSAFSSSVSKSYRLVYNSYNGRVYACGDFGILILNKTSGIITSPDADWNVNQIIGPNNRVVYSFDVLKDGTIIAGNSGGTFRYNSANGSWVNLSTNTALKLPGDRFCIKADVARKIIAAIGIDPTTNFYKIYSSVDNGNTLQGFQTNAVAVNTSKAGGLKSVYPHYNSTRQQLSLYISNMYEINYAESTGSSIQIALSTMQTNSRLSWSSQITGTDIGHTDTRQIVFLSQGVFPEKMAITSDGGFHIADIELAIMPGRYKWSMENTSSGLKTLQVSSITGKNNEVFFATWHDAFGASMDGGNIFYNGLAGEGIVLSKQGIRGQWDDRIFVTDGVGAPIRNSREIFNIPDASTNITWNSPPNKFSSGEVRGPIFISSNIYVEQAMSPKSSTLFTWYITRNAGENWTAIGNSSLRRFGLTTGTGADATTVGRYSIYVPVLDATTVKLIQLINPTGLNTSLKQPRLTGLETGIGNLNVGDVTYGLFGVNPYNQQELLACDNTTGKLMKSVNGGDDWSEVTSFSSFYDEDREPSLKSSMGYNSVSSISYSPYKNGVVLVGTISQGIFLSKNNGMSWVQLNNPGVLMCTGFHWLSENNAFVATYGRGLFKINL